MTSNSVENVVVDSDSLHVATECFFTPRVLSKTCKQTLICKIIGVSH